MSTGRGESGLFEKWFSMKRLKRIIDNSDINRFRFHVQIVLFILVIYGGHLAIDLGNSLPTFSCAFVEKKIGNCYLYPLQHQLTLPLNQVFSGRGVAVLIGLGTFLLWFIVLNKGWCGWVCPLGTIQDWISRIREKAGLRYAEYSPTAFKRLGKIKYVLLALLILLPLGMGNHLLSHEFGTPFCMICPGRTILPLFNGDTSQLVVDYSSKTKMALTALGMAIAGLFVVGSFVKERFFCLFCPMAALHFAFSKASLLRLTKEGSKCTKCGNCYRVCDVGIREIADDVTNRNIVKDDCVMCFKCVAACPEEGCLDASVLGMSVYKSTEEGFFRREGRRAEVASKSE